MRKLILGSVAVLVALVLAPQPHAVRAAQPIVVIVGAKSAATDIDLGTLRRAFEGAPATLSGQRLIPVNHGTTAATRIAFDRQILKLEPGDVGKFWIDKRIRDEGAPPKTVPTPDLAVRLAGSVPGIITYGTQDLVNAAVKVLTIGGKAPGQPGYPLSL
ncbi:MAG: hypothetical protein ABW252_09460 [Polyangiales bacterium]